MSDTPEHTPEHTTDLEPNTPTSVSVEVDEYLAEQIAIAQQNGDLPEYTETYLNDEYEEGSRTFTIENQFLESDDDSQFGGDMDFSQIDDPFAWGEQNMGDFSFDGGDDGNYIDFAKQMEEHQKSIANGSSNAEDFINSASENNNAFAHLDGTPIDIPPVDPHTRRGTDGLTIVEKAELRRFYNQFAVLQGGMLKTRRKNYMDVIDTQDTEDLEEGQDPTETLRMTAKEVEESALAQQKWAETLAGSRAVKLREQEIDENALDYYGDSTYAQEQAMMDKKPIPEKIRTQGLGLYGTIGDMTQPKKKKSLNRAA